MAKNPHGAARSRPGAVASTDWIARSNPADLLSVDIFFDLRGVHGDGGLADAVWQAAFDAADGQVGFAKLLVEAVGTAVAALTLFGGFRTEEWPHRPQEGRPVRHRRRRACAGHLPSCDGAIDAGAPAPASRRWARRRDRSRRARRGAGRVPRSHSFAADRGHRAWHCRPPTRSLVKRLSARDRDRLREALAAVTNVDDLARDLLFNH